jgi:membrane protease YdiL (CAAX protease family)
MVLPLCGALGYFVVLQGGGAAQGLYAGSKLFVVVWPWIALRFILSQPWPHPRLLDARHARAAGEGLAAGLLLVACLAGLMATPLGNLVAQSAPAVAGKADDLGIREHFWAFAIFLSFANSLLEEVYWRWFLFGNLRRLLPPWPAHLLAGAAFSAHHFVAALKFFPLPLGLAAGFAVAAGGVLWSRMMERQRSLAGAWVCHAAVDLGIMGIGYRLLLSS